MKNLKYSLLMALAAFIWGSAFVAQSVGMDYIGPLTFLCSRSIVGCIVLIPIILISGKLEKKEGASQAAVETTAVDVSQLTGIKKLMATPRGTLIVGGIFCGICLCVASAFQQIGLVYTTAGKSGFITAMYILMVPIFGMFIGQKTNARVWICVGLGVVGMFLLCMTEGLSMSFGDFMVFLCAVTYSIHILVVDYFSPKVNAVKLSWMQFFVTAIISGICMFIFEEPAMFQVKDAIIPILYAGVMSSGIAFTLQIVAQKKLQATVASLIMSLESVFAVITAAIILHERLTSRELLGCIVMFIAIILAQLPGKKKISD